MIQDIDTISEALRLDGNAVAGEIQMLVGFDITTIQAKCNHCQNEGMFATLIAYVRGPGIILRCPTCEGLVLQIVKTPYSVIVNVEGMAGGVINTAIT